MLCAREYAQGIAQIVTLITAHGGLAHHAREFGRLAEAFVGSSPAFVTRDSDARRERPVDPCGFYFGRSDARRAFDKIRITRAAEPDVVWEEHRAEHVVVTMHRVDTVELWNTQRRDLRARLGRVLMVAP